MVGGLVVVLVCGYLGLLISYVVLVVLWCLGV